MQLRVIRTALLSLGLLHCSNDARPTKRGNDPPNVTTVDVGAPCVPSVELNPEFGGFRVTEETIETGAPACGGGVCLVNHFQGRVDCPLGQAAPIACGGPGDAAACAPGSACVEAAVLAPTCDPSSADKGASQCAGFGGVCDATAKKCACATDADCPPSARCDASGAPNTPHLCKQFACHAAGSCQSAAAQDTENSGKDCCVPGVDAPVTSAVCGQCAAQSNRDADSAVYCSCRCGPPEGEAPAPGAQFCDCPTGFVCEEIRKNIGVGDPNLTGKYCIKEGTAYADNLQCGLVKGYFDPNVCMGVAAP